jgi:hypothetical protein
VPGSETSHALPLSSRPWRIVTASSDPDARYMYPAQGWEIVPQPDGRIVIVFRLSGGPELCFQLDRTDAHRLLEELSAGLGILDMPSIPENQKH